MTFDGGAKAIPPFLGGKIEIATLQVGNLLPFSRNGTARILGVLDSQRSPLVPDVRTFEEQGYKIYSASSRGFLAPAGTPKEVVNLLSDAIKKTVAIEDQRKRMADMGLAIRYMDAAEYSAYWAASEAEYE